MNKYSQFHGEIPISDIGRELRKIALKETSFKVITGYGSTSDCCKSKNAVLKSLGKMKKEGQIQDYIPGEKVTELIPNPTDYYRSVKEKHCKVL